MTAGFKAAAKKNHWKLVVTDSGFDPSKQVSDIESLIARKVDAIIASPGDASALIPAYKEAAAAKIPIFSIANDIGPGGQKYETAFYGVDQAGIAARRTSISSAGSAARATSSPSAGLHQSSSSSRTRSGYQRVVAKAAGIRPSSTRTRRISPPMRGCGSHRTRSPRIPMQAACGSRTTTSPSASSRRCARWAGRHGRPLSRWTGPPQVFDPIAKGDVTERSHCRPTSGRSTTPRLIQKALQKKAIPKKIFGPAYSVTKANVASFKAQCTKRPREVWCGK